VIDLGIIILNYNTRDVLRECLRSLMLARGLEFETMVVDNCSSDGSEDMVRREFPQVRLIGSPRNGGYAFGNNQGLREFLSREKPPRALMLLNTDTIISPDALRGLMDFLDAHPQAGVVGPKMVLRDGSLDLACRRSFPTPQVSFYRMVGLSKLFPRSPRFGRYNLTYLDENETAQVDSVVGACMLIRTEALKVAGILDESFFMYGEDLDLSLRIKSHGWQVYYYPGVQILHYKRESSKRSRRAQVEFYRAMYIFYRKHYARTTPLWLHALVLGGIAARGGLVLAREMLRPLPAPPNYAEIKG
jgi:N-acetylglucosaminyl-diphospho-decaprenol L-rhamnosyltransferase